MLSCPLACSSPPSAMCESPRIDLQMIKFVNEYSQFMSDVEGVEAAIAR
ncbi:hypothetical protein DVUA0128 (plasmid) [Nitratidesulfovibrio vulgaris str. Hildenborough]|uniref:Uncharacterized protein n=1 Tax=Nitratidesulfovibrio vulgaris (strain ATCC 29579 / DSM 644 / CCUG 34227 / NCIMB 8303 / VKM B-1760 / Hildenborough) TaxID=882 RepID=Q72WG1_NITV2|nr:hypothetical protein DVUA0128 [Nitratidesulfovibrio vulgaris str. Hildenborough]